MRNLCMFSDGQVRRHPMNGPSSPQQHHTPHRRWAAGLKRSALLILLPGMLIWSQTAAPLWAQKLTPPNSLAAPEGLAADQLVAFAEQLMREGEYFRAITEYRRFLFFYPHDHRRPMIHFRIGLAYYRGRRYGEALRTFRDVARTYPQSAYAQLAWLWQGESLMRQAQYQAANQVYTEMLARFPHAPIRQQAYYQRGWALLYQRQWHQASRQFHRVPPDAPLYRTAQRLAEDVLDGEQLSQKSPLLAGVLSGLLPGSGQWYNGRLGDALLAFFLNGLFVVGIREAITQNELAIAGALSFFEAGWYAGNVYGAINGAYKYNRHAAETFLHNLENRYRLPPPAETRQAIGLRMRFDF